MVMFMLELRRKRLDAEREENRRWRRHVAISALRAFKGTPLFLNMNATKKDLVINLGPGAPDWLQFPVVKKYIEEDEEEESPLHNSINEIMDDLLSWINSVHLALLIRYSGGWPDERRPESVCLASRGAVCHHCDAVLFYPEVLFHPCNTTKDVWGLEDSPYDSDDEEAEEIFDLRNYGADYVRKPWSAEDIGINKRLKVMIEQVITFMGLDPATALPQDLDKKDVYLECIDCEHTTPLAPRKEARRDKLGCYLMSNNNTIPKTRSSKPKLYLFGWRRFVSHLLV